IYTKRTEINKKLNIANVLDTGVKKILDERLEQYGGDKAKAFSNLTANPIYLNREKEITIKKVTVKASRVSNPIAIHKAKDHLGNELHAEDGSAIPVDYVAPDGNYQAAFYETPEGKVEEIVVTNFEAVRRAIQNPPLPIIDREYNSDKGWKLLMSLKKNEYVVFPAYKTSESGKIEIKTFDPKEIDLLNPANYPLISPNLFRVQKLSEGDYTFRHHLETTGKKTKDSEETKDSKKTKGLPDITYKRIQSTNQLKDVVKVRVDALGRIVAVGEE
ncbi:MAG: type II CRISPR RNA-guided endonuclease Cas9, partial [Duncaniella sp.]|nr:type II CRISPR RNA-guided endonuclease Cas9 [Duncaniella sp.]